MKIAVIGAGVVGFATGSGFAATGADVAFIDRSQSRREALRRDGWQVVDEERLRDFRPDMYLLSVPTATVDDRCDVSAISDACSTIGEDLRFRDDWSTVVVRSTVPPGTSTNLVRPILEKCSRLSAGRDFGLAMNPEFLRAMTAREDFSDPRVIVWGAYDTASDCAMKDLYRPWKHVPQISMTLEEAEATKYAANLFNAAKISFFNELHTVFERLGIDSPQAFAAAAQGAEGMWNPVYGTRGGMPFGGECLPKDLAAFIGFAGERGLATPLLQAVADVNERLSAMSVEQK